MKKKLIFLVSFLGFLFSLNTAKAQTYGTINYWGKSIPIDKAFFTLTNIEFGPFLMDSRSYRYYDFDDYEKLYAECIEVLKDPNSTIFLSESNNLSFRGTKKMPGFGVDKKIGKKSMERAINIGRFVLMPAIQVFVERYNLAHPEE